MSQFKLFFLVIVIAILSSQNVYASKTNYKEELLVCSQVNDSLARLTCFDNFIEKNNIAAANDKNAQAATSLTQLPVTSQPTSQDVDDFAKEHLTKSEEELAKQINSITLTISALNKTAYGKWIVSFDNGQKWQQQDNTTLRLKKGQRAILTKGALNAIYLQKENSKKRIKVKRLK